MESKLAIYFQEYLEDMGYTEDEIADMGEPLVLEFVNFWEGFYEYWYTVKKSANGYAIRFHPQMQVPHSRTMTMTHRLLMIYARSAPTTEARKPV